MKVDVILPVYRGRRWLHEAVGSVFAQTFEDWHLWIVDDASPDDSLTSIAEFCESYPERLSTLRLERNHGAAAARMILIEKGSAQAIAFLDQDDRWHPEKLALQIECLERHNAAAVHTDVHHIDAEGRLLTNAAMRENELRKQVGFERLSRRDLTRHLFLENTIRLGSSLVLRAAFEQAGGFHPSLRGGEDWEFWVRFATQHGICHLPQPLLERRVHERNTSSLDATARRVGTLEALRMVETRQPELRLLGKRRRALIEQRAAIEALLAQRNLDARRSAWALARLRPCHWRTLALLLISVSGPLRPLLVRTVLRG